MSATVNQTITLSTNWRYDDDQTVRTKQLEYYVRSRHDIKVMEGKPLPLNCTFAYNLDTDSNKYVLNKPYFW